MFSKLTSSLTFGCTTFHFNSHGDYILVKGADEKEIVLEEEKVSIQGSQSQSQYKEQGVVFRSQEELMEMERQRLGKCDRFCKVCV